MLDWNHGRQLKKRKNINKLQMQALKTKLLSFLSSFGKVLKEAWWGPPTTPPPAVRDLPKAFGFPPLIWYLQTECTRMRLLFSFHFRESAERASYSTNPWRNAQYLCGNVCRHCASREKRNSHARLSCTPVVYSERVRSEMMGNTAQMCFWSGISELVCHSFERIPKGWLGCSG